MPDYRVSLAEQIIPAADLSEQISTAGTEASGTGNMKLALNGALTIGTLDGANIEIRDAVGAENLYIFGLRTEQIADAARARRLRPARDATRRAPPLRRVLDALASRSLQRRRAGRLRADPAEPARPRRSLLRAGRLRAPTRRRRSRSRRDYRDAEAWSRRAVLNVARMGYFSADRAVREYAERIWRLDAVAEPRRRLSLPIAPLVPLASRLRRCPA